METLLPTRHPAAAISFVSTISRGSPAVLGFPCNLFLRRGGRSPSGAACVRNASSSHSVALAGPRELAVDVIAIGSRKDAFIDFCLDSPFAASSRLRLWTIHIGDSSNMQLLQRSPEKDRSENLEFPLPLHPCPAAIILVASAGHDRDHIAAMKILNAVKSVGGLAVAVLLRPFSFEGQRRHLEVNGLLKRLQDCSISHIVVEADALLKTEMETLAEALKSSNNAVLLAINTISVLTSETNKKFLVVPSEQIKDLKVSEVLKLLESHGKMKVGFGAGYNIKSSITQATLHCPFLNGGMKCLNGTIILTLSRSCEMERSDLPMVIHVFRQITGFQGEIIFSAVHEPDLEPKLVVTTLFILGGNEQTTSPQKSFLSGLALRLPFLSSLLIRTPLEQKDNLSSYSHNTPEDALIASDGLEMGNSTDGDIDLYREEMKTDSSGKISGSGNEKSVNGLSEVSNESASSVCNDTNEGNMLRISKSNVFTLPVGVKSSRLSDISQSCDPMDGETLYGTGGESLRKQGLHSHDESTDTSVEVGSDIYTSGLTFLKGKGVDVPRRRGVLSARAESMLETEREAEKSWTPVIQMQYRGGTYSGRCQGGLPEGKGHLTFEDGSFYDGMWRCGRRSGLGTFCYSNGDVFQGSWRDDLMHGKGWFYFQTGDRWFVNFWKGKANGEGRFYSKSGSVFFGHFRDGWRHGQSLSIDALGSRWAETWEDGVLLKRTKLET